MNLSFQLFQTGIKELTYLFNLTMGVEVKTAHKAIIFYFTIGVIYSIYSWFFGDNSNTDKGFISHSIATTALWPAVMFPIIGKIIGVVIIITVVSVAVFS